MTDLQSEAICLLDEALNKPPTELKHEVDSAERAVVALRDNLIDQLRTSGAAGVTAELDSVNAALSLIVGLEYPMGGLQRDMLKQARLVLNEDGQAYASIIDEPSLLRQTFVHRAGHCAFTPAETIAAFNALVNRLDSGQWAGPSPWALDAAAQGLGPDLNVFFAGTSSGIVTVPTAPAFVSFTPSVFLRLFSLHAEQEEGK